LPKLVFPVILLKIARIFLGLWFLLFFKIHGDELDNPSADVNNTVKMGNLGSKEKRTKGF